MPDVVVKDAEVEVSWLRRNWIKLHGSAIISGWGILEWLAPRAADKLHQFVLHIFWSDIMHKIFQTVRGF